MGYLYFYSRVGWDKTPPLGKAAPLLFKYCDRFMGNFSEWILLQPPSNHCVENNNAKISCDLTKSELEKFLGPSDVQNILTRCMIMIHVYALYVNCIVDRSRL